MTENELFQTIYEMKRFASKDLGQNFLINKETIKKIVELLDIKDNEEVLEIGSGFGSLSYFLAQKESNLTLDDVDERAINFLKELFKDNEKVNIIKQSILKLDISNYDKIIGNLPYYITSGILEKVLVDAKNCKKFVFMVQREVKQRLLAKIGSEDYSPLTILLSLRGDVKEELVVTRGNFVPVPHVDSAVFSLDLKTEDYDVTFIKNLLFFTKKMFLHRRKTIFNNLSNHVKNKIEAASILKSVNIDLNLRPQDISPLQYRDLVNYIYK